MQQTMNAATSRNAAVTDGTLTAPSDTQMSQEAFEATLATRFREIGMLTKSLLEAEAALKREQAAHEATRAALAQAEYASQSYHEMVLSTSWRITAPLRRVMTLLRR